MARPRTGKTGRRVTLYLSALDLHRLGGNPAEAIRGLIRGLGKPEPNKVYSKDGRELCVRCQRLAPGVGVKGCCR